MYILHDHESYCVEGKERPINAVLVLSIRVWYNSARKVDKYNGSKGWT